MFLSYLSAFMNASDSVKALSTLPMEIRLPPLEFEDSKGESLFDRLTKARVGQGNRQSDKQ